MAEVDLPTPPFALSSVMIIRKSAFLHVRKHERSSGRVADLTHIRTGVQPAVCLDTWASNIRPAVWPTGFYLYENTGFHMYERSHVHVAARYAATRRCAVTGSRGAI